MTCYHVGMKKYHVLKINHDTETSVSAIRGEGEVIETRGDHNAAADIWAAMHARDFTWYDYFDLVVMDEHGKHVTLVVTTKCVPEMRLSDCQDLA